MAPLLLIRFFIIFILLTLIMEIILDDLTGSKIKALLKEHLEDMYATSPPESVHALDIEKLKNPQITFFSAWKSCILLGCVAIKHHNDQLIELKSMRTSREARGQGVASKLLEHVINITTEKGYKTLALETGTQDYFLPARSLYSKFGFNFPVPERMA